MFFTNLLPFRGVLLIVKELKGFKELKDIKVFKVLGVFCERKNFVSVRVRESEIPHNGRMKK